MGEKPERKLRPKTPVLDEEEDRFNFDIPEMKICPDKKLVVASRGGALVLLKKDVSGIAEKKKQIKAMRLKITQHRLSNIPEVGCDDLLSDDAFRAYHKKMQKQESRMINNDKMQSEAEAERLQNLFEKLDLFDWISALMKLTVIKNPNDKQELLVKRDLTKQAVERMLNKFRNMKRRSNLLSRNYRHGRIDALSNRENLYSRVDRNLIMGYDSSSDEEEEHMSPEEIRRHRKHNREKNYGGSIIIQLKRLVRSKAKFAIVAEPLRTSYIVKCTKKEREIWSAKAADLPNKFAYYPRFPKQVAIERCRVEIPTFKENKKRELNKLCVGSSFEISTESTSNTIGGLDIITSTDDISTGLEHFDMPSKKRKSIQITNVKMHLDA